MPADAPSPEPLGTRLHRVREGEQLSTGTLASMLNVSSDTIRDIEAGRVTQGVEVDRVRAWLDTSIDSRPDT